jgi:hypothetical protein
MKFNNISFFRDEHVNIYKIKLPKPYIIISDKKNFNNISGCNDEFINIYRLKN